MSATNDYLTTATGDQLPILVRLTEPEARNITSHDVQLLYSGNDYDGRELIGIYTTREEAEREIVRRALAHETLREIDIVPAELHGNLDDLIQTAMD